mmetsp:Transcript_77849/g.208018  ORF Transcript_77849/g.208018 Transcript_77849/m.208018 type:complete len:240 (-) Transcript_77849:463-1182(-)
MIGFPKTAFPSTTWRWWATWMWLIGCRGNRRTVRVSCTASWPSGPSASSATGPREAWCSFGGTVKAGTDAADTSFILLLRARNSQCRYLMLYTSLIGRPSISTYTESSTCTCVYSSSSPPYGRTSTTTGWSRSRSSLRALTKSPQSSKQHGVWRNLVSLPSGIVVGTGTSSGGGVFGVSSGMVFSASDHRRQCFLSSLFMLLLQSGVSRPRHAHRVRTTKRWMDSGFSPLTVIWKPALA